MVELGVPTASFGKPPLFGEQSFPGVSMKFAPQDQLQVWRDRLRAETLSRNKGVLLESSVTRRGGVHGALDAHKGRGMDLMPGYSNINTVYDHSGFQYDVGTGRWRPPTEDELAAQERADRRRLRREAGGSRATPPRSRSESHLSAVPPRPLGSGSGSRPASGCRSQLSALGSSVLACSIPPARSSLACSHPPIFGSSSDLVWADIQ